jgi:hypothetical protein
VPLVRSLLLIDSELTFMYPVTRFVSRLAMDSHHDHRQLHFYSIPQSPYLPIILGFLPCHDEYECHCYGPHRYVILSSLSSTSRTSLAYKIYISRRIFDRFEAPEWDRNTRKRYTSAINLLLVLPSVLIFASQSWAVHDII